MKVLSVAIKFRQRKGVLPEDDGSKLVRLRYVRTITAAMDIETDNNLEKTNNKKDLENQIMLQPSPSREGHTTIYS